MSPAIHCGESQRSIKERFLEHKGYVNNKNLSKATGSHFNQKGHKISDMEITILEKIFNPDPQFRKQREKMYINKFNTKYKGINRSNGGWNFANCKQKIFWVVFQFGTVASFLWQSFYVLNQSDVALLKKAKYINEREFFWQFL